MFLRGRDTQGEEFLELTKTLDISAVGAFVVSPQAVKADAMVWLTVPAPSAMGAGVVPVCQQPTRGICFLP
jgi:hypothetical protein